MKIFFNASISGKQEYEKNYDAIIQALRQLSHTVYSPLENKRTSQDVAIESVDQASRYYGQLRKRISASDFCVFEVSYPSTGIGHEVTLALEFGKSVIAFHVKGRDPFVLEAIDSDKLQVLEYTRENIIKELKGAVEISSDQMDTRFNFFISRKLSVYLDWKSRVKRIPRAVYLRQLIRKEMKNTRWTLAES